MASSLDEQDIQCPYCGESITVLVDPSETGSEYVEDCQVCCRPIEFSVQESHEGEVYVSVRAENE